MPLKISVSGIRGVVGDGLDPELVVRISAALGIYSSKKSKKIVVGRDTRNSGEMINQLVCGALMGVGCDVIDIGIASTPTTQMAVEYFNAGGGIIITASHNPIQWNALKLLRHDGIFLYSDELELVLEISKRPEYKAYDKLGEYRLYADFFNYHKKRVLHSIDIDALREKKYRVIFDAVNGAGYKDTEDFLRDLGCEVIGLNTENQGYFNHNPEPIKENLEDLIKVVRENKADIGFAQDADADRLAIVSDCGEFIGEEYTQVLSADYVLRHNKGNIVTNLSSSRLMDDVASKYGVKCLRSKVGEVNVVELLKKERCVFGGEGNGGVIYPDIHLGRDSFIGMAFVLSLMSIEEQPISKIVDTFPKYTMIKKKFPFEASKEDIKKIFKAFVKKTKELADSCECGNIISENHDDGLKIDFDNSWVHIRVSNTEPVMRIITESKSFSVAEKLNKETREIIEALVNK